MRPLLDECAGAAPARVFEEVDDDAEKPLGGLGALVIGPVNKHRTTDDEIARHETPVTTVFTIVPVIAHHEITSLRYDELILALEGVVSLIVIRRSGLVIDVVEFTGFAFRVVINFQRILAIVICSGDVMLGDNLTIHDDVVSINPDSIAGKADHALHVVGEYRTVVRPVVAFGIVRVSGILEDYNVAALDLALRQKR